LITTGGFISKLRCVTGSACSPCPSLVEVLYRWSIVCFMPHSTAHWIYPSNAQDKEVVAATAVLPGLELVACGFKSQQSITISHPRDRIGPTSSQWQRRRRQRALCCSLHSLLQSKPLKTDDQKPLHTLVA